MNCESCGHSIRRRKDGFELCSICYLKALDNQRLLGQELATWAKENELYIIKVIVKGGKP